MTFQCPYTSTYIIHSIWSVWPHNCLAAVGRKLRKLEYESNDHILIFESKYPHATKLLFKTHKHFTFWVFNCFKQILDSSFHNFI
ncbi:hypothetical protein BpHYR1_011938 [Brachionus plicatilis]|uniref:Uncharacterized protein n=1 Tax=Brachionus plicatilis TaxID=10195 RepID=A0A3M7SMF2_BRAPC|nr:hypothetical protein BpHYR1_011938 [Brachionus plicatilis]